MDPNIQQPVQPTSGIPPVTPQSNPYGFILDTQHKPKKTVLQPDHSSTRSRILIALGGVLILIIAAMVFNSVISGGKQGNTTAFKKLAAEQQEIARIADIGVTKASDPSVAAFAETTKLTVQSQQTQTVSYLAKNKIKLTPVILNAQKNTKTDAALTAAIAANRFDALFTETLKSELTTYANDLKTAYTGANGTTSKTILSNSYSSVTLLLK